jgi:hypothetical protein
MSNDSIGSKSVVTSSSKKVLSVCLWDLISYAFSIQLKLTCSCSRTITIHAVTYYPGFYLKQRFGDWILSPSSGGTYSV